MQWSWLSILQNISGNRTIKQNWHHHCAVSCIYSHLKWFIHTHTHTGKSQDAYHKANHNSGLSPSHTTAAGQQPRAIMIHWCILFNILKHLIESWCQTTANLPHGHHQSLIKPHYSCTKPTVLGAIPFEFTSCNISDVLYEQECLKSEIVPRSFTTRQV